MSGRTVSVTLDIVNTYEGGEEVRTEVVADVPAPPPESDHDAYEAWAYEHIYAHTGTGRTEGDAWYDVVITWSSDPALIGRTFEWGY